MSNGTGTVHDKGEPGMSPPRGIGYIYVKEINGFTPRRSQFIPFVLNNNLDKELRIGDRVTFDITSNVIYPSNGIMAGSPVPLIRMAVNVDCCDSF